MNKVELIGRITHDLELKYGGETEESSYVKFFLAVPRRYKKGGDQETDFVSCIAFRGKAEFMEKYVKRGMRISIVGRIRTGSYERDGTKIYSTVIVVEEVEILEAKKDKQSPDMEKPPSNSMGDSFMDIPDNLDDEIPFR